MSEYQVKINPRLGSHLAQHAEFIARVSKPAAIRFRKEFSEVLQRLADNPFQFPVYDDPNLPPDLYRKALFAKWYKVVFYVEESTVYIDAVVDGRKDFAT